MTKFVYDFSEGNKDMKDLLGGKGANLAEMTTMGLPVPHGFTITTEACLTFLAEGGSPGRLHGRAREHVQALEESMGKQAAAIPPTRCWSRSVRRQVLDAGHDGHGPQPWAERRVREGTRRADRGRRAVRARRLPAVHPDVREDRHGRPRRCVRGRSRRREGRRVQTRTTPTWTPTTCGSWSSDFQAIYRRAHGEEFPRTRASSCTRRSRPSSRLERQARDDYRRQNKIPDDLGTAVNVQSMVFGNRGDDSGTGVASPAIQRPASRCLTATTWSTRRARTSSPASATPCRSPTWSGRPGELRNLREAWTRSSSTTATCATSSSRSSKG